MEFHIYRITHVGVFCIFSLNSRNGLCIKSVINIKNSTLLFSFVIIPVFVRTK